MATLDRVLQLKSQGVSDNEISSMLQNEGVSPREVNDALNQARIKGAVSSSEYSVGQEQIPQGVPSQTNQQVQGQGSFQNSSSQNFQNSNPDMQPSIMPNQGVVDSQQQNQQYSGVTEQAYPPEQNFDDQQVSTEDYDSYYSQAPNAYADQGYYNDYYGGQGGYTDMEMVSEIAEQIVVEKMSDFKVKVGDLQSFKSSVNERVDDIDDRLKRIEASIDSLQHSVINKIGQFGESGVMIQRDLENLHGTVSKLIDPLMDNYNELKKLNKKGSK